jgi:hypothetical protein
VLHSSVEEPISPGTPFLAGLSRAVKIACTFLITVTVDIDVIREILFFITDRVV